MSGAICFFFKFGVSQGYTTYSTRLFIVIQISFSLFCLTRLHPYFIISDKKLYPEYPKPDKMFCGTDKRDVPDFIADGFVGADLKITPSGLLLSNCKEAKCCSEEHVAAFVDLLKSGDLQPNEKMGLFAISITAITPREYVHRHARIERHSGKVVYIEHSLPLSKIYGSNKSERRWSLTARTFDVAVQKEHTATFSRKQQPGQSEHDCHKDCMRFLDTLSGGHSLINWMGRRDAKARTKVRVPPSSYTRQLLVDPLWATVVGRKVVPKKASTVVKTAKPAPPLLQTKREALEKDDLASTGDEMDTVVAAEPFDLVKSPKAPTQVNHVAPKVTPPAPKSAPLAAPKRAAKSAVITHKVCKIPKVAPKPAPLVEQTSRDSASSGRQEFLTLSASSSMDLTDAQGTSHFEEPKARQVTPLSAQPTSSAAATPKPANFLAFGARDFDTVLHRARFHLDDLPKSEERLQREWKQIEGKGTLVQKYLKQDRIVDEAKIDAANFARKGNQSSFNETLYRRGLKECVNAHRLTLLKLNNAVDYTNVTTNMAMEARHDKLQFTTLAAKVCETGVITDEFREYVKGMQADHQNDRRALNALVRSAQTLHEIRPLSCAGGSDNVEEALRYRDIREFHVARLDREAPEEGKGNENQA